MDKIESIVARIRNLRPAQYYGQVQQMRAGLISVEGLNGHASVGDRVLISLQKGCVAGEIVGLAPDVCDVLPEGNADGLSVGAEVELLFAPTIAPCDSWIGRIIDPLGRPLDNRPLPKDNKEKKEEEEGKPCRTV